MSHCRSREEHYTKHKTTWPIRFSHHDTTSGSGSSVASSRDIAYAPNRERSTSKQPPFASQWIFVRRCLSPRGDLQTSAVKIFTSASYRLFRGTNKLIPIFCFIRPASFLRTHLREGADSQRKVVRVSLRGSKLLSESCRSSPICRKCPGTPNGGPGQMRMLAAKKPCGERSIDGRQGD